MVRNDFYRKRRDSKNLKREKIEWGRERYAIMNSDRLYKYVVYSFSCIDKEM